MGQYVSLNMWFLHEGLGQAQRALDLAILATPTGEIRNELCDANIHLARAIALLKKEGEIPP